MYINTDYPEKSPSMEDLIARLPLAADRLQAAVAGLTDEECNRKVVDDEESIWWCVEHVAGACFGWSDIFYDAIEGVYDTPKSQDTAWIKPLTAQAALSVSDALIVYRAQNEALAAFLGTLPASDFDRGFRIVSFLTEPYQIKESINWGSVIHCDFHLATIHKLRTALGKPLDWMAVYLERFPRES